MLVCIPTNGNAGAEDTVCDHFGSAPFFTLYDTESEEITVLDNSGAHHSHGTCHPLRQLNAHKLDCVVCNGIGRRAVGMLNQAGIKVLNPGVSGVKEVLAKVKADELTEIDPRSACGGHGGGVHGGCHHAPASIEETEEPPRPRQ